MNSQADNRAQESRAIFLEALDRPAGSERTSYLDEACGTDMALRREVESLLLADQKAGAFLDPVAFGAGLRPDQSPLTEAPGTIIGRYKLLEKIGEGGMAVVYMAEQTEPIRRRVALKIIKLGMDTRQVIARFEAERQALALMDHPSIAKVLDAGATETGRPYFVMELVAGVSITEYCDKNSLSTKDRLALFLQVCNAVQHAHQKGIIHRDLKPSNVMVTHHDGKPVPKVIDFGIAKATNQKLTEKTLFTRYAHIIGTPAYMSPEQAELSDLDIDTRSDIYSLGVLLYELLTGTTPFSEEELRKAGYIEMQRVIREQEPVKPSTRIRTALRGASVPLACKTSCGDARPTKSASSADRVRGTPYQQVRGDLDWIVMKSLEKDRIRRYETANGLAEDIRRHLEHEPVLARGPGTTYRLGKFLRKHRAQAIAALALVITAGAVLVILSMWNRYRLQLVEAEGFRHRGILSQAQGQYAQADRPGALKTITPLLHSKHVGPEAQLLYAGILVDTRQPNEAVTTLENLLKERPEIAGAAHALLTRILWESQSPNAERRKEIEEHRQKAQALRPDTAEAYFLRAMTSMTVKEQLAALDKALELDSKHYESRRLRAFTYYASRKYERLNEEALVMETLRDRDSLGYSLRATALRELKRYQDAISEYDNALALTPRDNPQYLDLSVQRCETFLRMGDYKRVLSETRRYLSDVGAKNLSPVHYYLFCALTALGDYEAAWAQFRQIVRFGADARGRFEDWCAKYVFDTLAAGQSWHPPNREPAGIAFLPLVEAEEMYRQLSAKARRVLADGFTARWSPDGKRLAFSMGFVGYNGVALYDPATHETDLLIVPGKDPMWSPDGRYIAFTRDCQALRVPEFATAERRELQRPGVDEEVWVMKSDGTEPRRLARGGWPSWSQDSRCVYYHSRLNGALYSISLDERDAEPNTIVACPNSFPALSPDGQQVACVEGDLLRVRNVTSGAVVAQWPVPPAAWGGPAWSPNGSELCMGTNKIGLWVYCLDRSEPLKILDGQIKTASWSRDGKKLVFHLGAPYYEIWAADLDPRISVLEALGSGRTLAEHVRDLIAPWTRRIEADPTDPDNYSRRAAQYRFLHEDAQARADGWRWWAALHPGWPAVFRFRGPWSIMHTINGPFDYQLVIFLERQEDGMQLLRIAFGQKGRSEMKSLEMPMVVTSLVGLCFLAGWDAPPAQASFTFGPRVTLGPTVNSPQGDGFPILARNGLELYFASDRPGGYGNWDIWMSQRASTADPWGPPVNLGPGVNSTSYDCPSSISSDGLTLYWHALVGNRYDLFTATRPAREIPWGPRLNLSAVLHRAGGSDIMGTISPDDLELYFGSNRPGALGNVDIYVTTRATPADPWGVPVNLGPTVNTPAWECPGSISPDGLVLFIGATNRPGGLGGGDELWMIRRPYKGAAWSEPVHMGLPSGEGATSLSADGQWAYFTEHQGGIPATADLWMAPIIPTVDFDASGIVDFGDLVMLIDNWSTNKTLCDIGPFAWGDGQVDSDDLRVFMTYYEKASPLAQSDGITLLDFVPTAGSPEGVAVDKAGNVYITVRAGSDQVWKFSPAGANSVLADLGKPGGGALGLATDAAGNVYACRASVTNEGVPVPNHGVYRVAPDGKVTLLPGTEQIVFPNAVALDEQETLYVTEMFSGDFASHSFGPGGLWRLSKGAAAQLWIRDELLTGVAPSLFPFPVGANGIAFYGGALYVANPDKALIVRVPVRVDGSAGQPETWKKIEDVPESFLHGSPVFPVMIDGLTFDGNGNAYVTVVSRNAIVRIDADDRSQQTIAVYPQVPLDAPANVAFGTNQSPGDSLFITNMGMCKTLIPNMPWPGPGLVKISLPGSKGSN